MDDFRLDGRVAIVTGGGRGIGSAVCKRLGAAGAHVVVNYANSEDGARACVGEIVAAGGSAEAIQADVRSLEQVQAMVDGVLERYDNVDILVNNAGIVKDTLLLTMSEDQWVDVVDTNLSGIARCIMAVGRTMMLNRRGAIVNLSSIAAAHPNRGQANYAASKGGIESLTRALAVELGRKGVRVNAVAPGIIETDMSQRVRDEAGKEIKKRVLLRRFGKPEEVASAVHFLVSDASAYVTGQVLTVDGGIGLS